MRQTSSPKFQHGSEIHSHCAQSFSSRRSVTCFRRFAAQVRLRKKRKKISGPRVTLHWNPYTIGINCFTVQVGWVFCALYLGKNPFWFGLSTFSTGISKVAPIQCGWNSELYWDKPNQPKLVVVETAGPNRLQP